MIEQSAILRCSAVALLLCCLLVSACGKKGEAPPAATGNAAAAGAQQTQPPPGGAMPATAVTQASWAPDALEKLVAPIALYPDQLVGQILTASVNPQEVLDAGNWLLQNESLKGDALDAAAQTAGFGPAMRALVQFPTVVDMMCQQMDWTRQLGSAFTSDQKGVLDAVQRLRSQAQQVGNLKSTPQQKVESKTEDNKTIIEVKPADPQIIYVPQYNPQVVYTTPPPPPPPAQSSDTVSTGAAVVGGLLAFGVGIAIGSAIHNDDYCYPHWGAGAVYVGPRPFYPPAYVYHPAYGPGFRPAYGYAPPPSYRYNYRNANVNGNVNINVNNSNNNYFNQFNHNQNLRTNTQSNISGATRNPAASNPAWKGQSSYAGAHGNPAQNARFNEASGRTPSTSYAGANHPGDSHLGAAGGTRNPALEGAHPSGGNLGSTRAGGGGRGPEANLGANRGAPAADRGFGDSNRNAGGSNLGANRAATAAPAGGGNPSGGLNRSEAAPAHQGAFSGAADSGGGHFARQASARGGASAGGGAHVGGGRFAR